MSGKTKKHMLRPKGLLKLELELDDLKVNKRKDVAGKIKEAREQGDLSENAEYDAAKDEQRDIEARISQISAVLKNAEKLLLEELSMDAIEVGHTVKLLEVEFDEEVEYTLVGSPEEIDSMEGMISDESPVGKSLIGAKIGDVVGVKTQAGIFEYEVLEIKIDNEI